MKKTQILPREERAYALPMVLILVTILTVVAYATLLQANNGLNLAYKQTYIQVARIASKAAVDFAQEQFDNSACGNYTGSSEQDLIANERYRATIKSEVISTSADGYEKVIKGTGSIYLPKASSTAKYVFDIRSEIVRTYATCKTPDNFAPKLWLDASDTSTLKKVGSSTTSLTPTPSTTFVNAADSTRDTLEERVDNGAQTTNSWQSNDFEMHTCDSTEFSASVCSTNSTKYLYNGMVYSNVNVPKNSTITSATITLACTTPSGTSGALGSDIYGIYKSAGNPHIDLFTSTGTNQLKTPMTTASLRTTAKASVSSNNCPPGNNTVFNVTSVVQEMVNNSSWNPTGPGNGGRMGFGFVRTSGNGSRHLLKAGNLLNISYSATTVDPANNLDSIGIWQDKSGNNNHAVFAYGTAPTRQDGQINSKTVVRFNNGALLSALNSAITNGREMTVFAVSKANFATSSNAGRLLTGMSSTGTNDTTSAQSIIPIRREGLNNAFAHVYSGSVNTNSYLCGGTCASTPYIYTSAFSINSTNNTITAILKGNGSPVATTNNVSPSTATPPYTFSIDQFYLGGRRNGTMAAGSGQDYFNGDYAEVVVYDKALTCRQIEALEEYFRAKWNINTSAYPTTCPADVIPTL
jgi:hypothetical protein